MLHDSVSRPSAPWVRPNACKPHNCAYESVCVFDWCFESFIVDGGWWLAWVVCVLMCMDIINKCVNYYVLSSDEKQIKKNNIKSKQTILKIRKTERAKWKKQHIVVFASRRPLNQTCSVVATSNFSPARGWLDGSVVVVVIVVRFSVCCAQQCGFGFNVHCCTKL